MTYQAMTTEQATEQGTPATPIIVTNEPVTVAERQCQDCLTIAPATDVYFYPNGRYLRSYCRDCQRERSRLARHGRKPDKAPRARMWRNERLVPIVPITD